MSIWTSIFKQQNFKLQRMHSPRHGFKAFIMSCGKSLSRVWLCSPMDYSPPGSSDDRIFQARILKWVAIFSSSGSSWPRDGTHISCIDRQIVYHWATKSLYNVLCLAIFKRLSSVYYWLKPIVSLTHNIFFINIIFLNSILIVHSN